MTKIVARAMVGLLLALLAGCAATGTKMMDMQDSIPALSPDKGRIYFYRTSSVMGGAITSDIRLNGEVVGRSTRGSFFYVDRVPGRYEAAASTETENSWKFELKAGETIYIKTSVGIGILVGRVIPELVNPGKARIEMASLAYTGQQ